MNRKQQQRELMAKVGAVLAPIEHVIANPADYSREDRAHVRAVFLTEHNRLGNDLSTFTRGGPADYFVEWQAIERPMGLMRHIVAQRELVEDPRLVGQSLPEYKAEVLAAIAAVPVRVADVTCVAGTPFTAYCRIKELCETTGQRLTLVDRYVDDEMLYRYFQHVPEHVEVTIVTWPEASHAGGKNNALRKFMAASKLYAIQRPKTYRLLENHNIHARRLLCDDQLYSLNDSIKSAAMANSFQLLRDPSSISLQSLNTEVTGGKELFGRAVTRHP